MPDQQAYMLGFNSLTVQAAIIVHTHYIRTNHYIIFIVILSEESMTLLSVRRRDEPGLAV